MRLMRPGIDEVGGVIPGPMEQQNSRGWSSVRFGIEQILVVGVLAMHAARYCIGRVTRDCKKNANQ
jgi:hypothetical protein